MTIISFKHRFIFFKSEKVAGTSLEIALSHFCGKDDIMSRFAFPRSNTLRERHYPYPVRSFLDVVTNGAVRKVKINSPIPARKYMGDDTFFSFLKISVTRNPYDRAVSDYAWRCRSRSVQERSVSDFRNWFMCQKTLYAPYATLTLERPYDAVDVMIRFEHFEEDLTALSRRLGLAENIYDIFKGTRAKGGVRPPQLTARACFEGFPEGIAKVKKNYAVELETFGYDLPWLSSVTSGGQQAMVGTAGIEPATPTMST
ncbi:MAG: sulfotransferase family 2 domain-containing protein [Alphaproteobacteria bacterium GM7ARS4]|nr:sulfotransferase family 2 domain-containing protein [Alphaproteobacteria bacterium GM7ARS4]